MLKYLPIFSRISLVLGGCSGKSRSSSICQKIINYTKGIKIVTELKPEKRRDPNNPCLFCTDPQGVILQNELAYSARDSYAVSAGHTVVIPKRHVASFFDLTPEEINACMALITEERKLLDQEFKPDGYNIGVNIGPAAGQSILHAHIHIIPRYKGDVENPQGGVRHVLPKNAHYTRT